MSSREEMARVFCSASQEEMEHLLDELLTDKEREALYLRWELMKMLRQGETQRAIASKLHVSLCKVTRGNKILKDDTSVTPKIMERLYND